MGNWIVHIVGETIDDDIAPIISKAVEDIQALNHRVKQVRFTTDAGERIIHITQKVEEVADTVAADVEKDIPPLAPEAEAADAALHVVGDGVEGAVNAVENAEGTPLGGNTPVNPPVAGASSTVSSPSSTTAPAAIP